MAHYVYESPDGGKTVYRRTPGDLTQEDISKLPWEERQHRLNLRERIMEDQLWHDIRTAAKTNTALQDALDRAKIIYALTKDYG